MRPPAYARSRYSTVRGKKSCASLALLAATTVASTMLPPKRTTTLPSACLATFPDSIEKGRPLMSVCTFWLIRTLVLVVRRSPGEHLSVRGACVHTRRPPGAPGVVPSEDRSCTSADPPSPADA